MSKFITPGLVTKVEFERVGHVWTVGIDERGDIRFSIDGGNLLFAKKFKDGAVHFGFPKTICVDGKETRCAGLKLDASVIEEFENISNKIKEDIRRKKNEKKKKEFEAIMNGDTSVGYLTIENDYSSGISLQTARRFNEQEKKKYSKEFQSRGFSLLHTVIGLKYITWRDLPNRQSDGSFCGCGNSVWILTPKEWNDYVELNERRKIAAEEKRIQEEIKRKEKILRETKEREDWFAQFDEYTVESIPTADEGGKTTKNIYMFKIKGETLWFCERNVFDFGVVVNPWNTAKSGYVVRKNGELFWKQDGDNDILLTQNEIICVETIHKYGKFSHSAIRM